MKRLFNILPWAAMLAMGIICLPQMGVTQERHPHIRAAMQELREARRELVAAARDFCGHRKDAVHECDEALKQLQLALDCDRK